MKNSPKITNEEKEKIISEIKKVFNNNQLDIIVDDLHCIAITEENNSNKTYMCYLDIMIKKNDKIYKFNVENDSIIDPVQIAETVKQDSIGRKI